jgi:hypothetical protein
MHTTNSDHEHSHLNLGNIHPRATISAIIMAWTIDNHVEDMKSLVPKRYESIFVYSRKMQSLKFTGKCIRNILDFGGVLCYM